MREKWKSKWCLYKKTLEFFWALSEKVTNFVLDEWKGQHRWAFFPLTKFKWVSCQYYYYRLKYHQVELSSGIYIYSFNADLASGTWEKRLIDGEQPWTWMKTRIVSVTEKLYKDELSFLALLKINFIRITNYFSHPKVYIVQKNSSNFKENSTSQFLKFIFVKNFLPSMELFFSLIIFFIELIISRRFFNMFRECLRKGRDFEYSTW